jgi:hypothetical protein
MNCNPRWTRATVHLAREGLLAIDDGRGLRLRVAAGSVWLTQHDDVRDVVLREGESFVIERRGRTLVQALGPSELRLDAANENRYSTETVSRLKGLA